MSFVKKIAGGLLGLGIGALFGRRRSNEVRERQVTRDDAAREAALGDELARRRGAAADRIKVAGGEPAGGFGKFIVGS